jgi:transcriptional regulator with XRE-family HTH domain
MTQEASARQLGIALNTWRQWEYGIAQPRQGQIDRIADLTEDPVIRIHFWLDIYLGGINLERTLVNAGAKVRGQESSIIRHANCAVEALKSLVAAAAARPGGFADQKLAHLADELVDAAAKSETAADQAVPGRAASGRHAR